jgi:hypothetical protein
MRFRIGVVLGLHLLASRAEAWERLTTKQGYTVEGEVSQAELVLHESGGGEVVIPKAALVQLDALESGLRATLRDGTVLEGDLVEKIEIGDGLVRRRFSPDEISEIEFHRFIEAAGTDLRETCPIRIRIDASPALFAESRVAPNTATRFISCNGGAIERIIFSRPSDRRPGKDARLTAEAHLRMPDGEDQLVDLSVDLMQGDRLIDRAHSRLTIAADATTKVAVELDFPWDSVDLSAPAPHLLVQLVRQDKKSKVERGSVFWWFTVHVPIP